MTTFEIIILIIIYMICYGYIATSFIKEKENVWLVIYLSVISLVFAIYAPVIIGEILWDKLNKN